MPDVKSVLEKCMDKASEMRNEKAKFLKKAFTCYLGIEEIMRTKYYCVRDIVLYKKRMNLKRKRQALEF